jgi:hypothetical protein
MSNHNPTNPSKVKATAIENYYYVNFWYYLINHKFLDIPPDPSLNNITDPYPYYLSGNFNSRSILVSGLGIGERPLYLLFFVSHQYSRGKMVCREFRLCLIEKYIPLQIYNLYDYYKKTWGWISSKESKIFVALKFVDPTTGFHSNYEVKSLLWE